MQILITHTNISRTRTLSISRWQLLSLALGLLLVITLISGTVYHFVFLKAAREGWPVVSPLIKLVVRDEFAQRDRYVRENLDAMAERLGQVQAKLLRLDAISERVSNLAGVSSEALSVPAAAASMPAPLAAKPPNAPTAPAGLAPSPRAAAPAPIKPAQGGPFIPFQATTGAPAGLTLEEMADLVSGLDASLDHRSDVFTLIESRLLEAKLRRLMVPSTVPVQRPIASGFGFRTDPFTGRAALHTGLDFPADIGTPIVAAAGGVVVNLHPHPQYGNVVEIDHGNGLSTRYAHVSKRFVQAGEIVKRGQLIAHVGNSGRSTGPHLHFEVLVDGVPQNPVKFLSPAGNPAGVAVLSAATTASPAGASPVAASLAASPLARATPARVPPASSAAR